jgi:hypothetical protein
MQDSRSAEVQDPLGEITVENADLDRHAVGRQSSNKKSRLAARRALRDVSLCHQVRPGTPGALRYMVGW